MSNICFLDHQTELIFVYFFGWTLIIAESVVDGFQSTLINPYKTKNMFRNLKYAEHPKYVKNSKVL